MNGSRQSWLGNFGDWLYDYAHLIITNIGALVLTCGAAWLSAPGLKWKNVHLTDGPGQLVVVGFIISVFGSVVSLSPFQTDYKTRSASCPI